MSSHATLSTKLTKLEDLKNKASSNTSRLTPSSTTWITTIQKGPTERFAYATNGQTTERIYFNADSWNDPDKPFSALTRDAPVRFFNFTRSGRNGNQWASSVQIDRRAGPVTMPVRPKREHHHRNTPYGDTRVRRTPAEIAHRREATKIKTAMARDPNAPACVCSTARPGADNTNGFGYTYRDMHMGTDLTVEVRNDNAKRRWVFEYDFSVYNLKNNDEIEAGSQVYLMLAHGHNQVMEKRLYLTPVDLYIKTAKGYKFIWYKPPEYIDTEHIQGTPGGCCQKKHALAKLGLESPSGATYGFMRCRDVKYTLGQGVVLCGL